MSDPIKKIQVWATSENGNGRVMDLGKFECLEDIEIRCGHFDKDVVITFDEILEEDEE